MRRPSPLGALVRGLAAGAVGSAVQSRFLHLTRGIAPHGSSRVFYPPEDAQRHERATETVARRFVEGLMKRGPLDREQKKRGAQAVHYAVGSVFGAAWALVRESHPALRGPLGIAGFGVAAWMIGDNLLYPVFRLGSGVQGYPLSTHAYALGAHLVFAAAVGSAYEALRPRSVAAAGAALWAARTDARLLPLLPYGARPLGHRLVTTAARIRARHPLEAAAEAFAQA
jgi:hypothetical protein